MLKLRSSLSPVLLCALSFGGCHRPPASTQTTGDELRATTRPAQEPAVVSFEPASQTIMVGEEASVDILIDAPVPLSHAPFWLLHDPEIIEVLIMENGDFMGRDGGEVAFMQRALETGEVVVGLSRLGDQPGVQGKGTLARVTVLGLAPGTSKLVFDKAQLTDSSNVDVLAEYRPGSIRVVPAEQ
jgi:general secretion pathway protein D